MESGRILIVEDESIVALDIQKSLEELGFQACGIVATGEEAIRLALETRPDLILMDIRLDGYMDGIETADRIRSVLDTPIIFLTAFADQATLDRAKIAEPFGYITKPLEIRDLRTTIQIALHRHALERRERQNTYRFEQVFNAVNYGLVLLDEKHTISIANQWALDYLQVLTQPDTLDIGDRLNHLNGQSVREYLESSSGTQMSRKHEIVVEGQPQRVFELDSVRLSSAPWDQSALAEQGLVMTIKEVTEARKHEHYVRKQERLAAVGQLAAGIAHDFGNILATISLAAEIIPQLEDCLSARSAQYLKVVHEQVQRAADLIAQVLDFSRTSALEKSTLDLIPLYKEWMKLLTQTISENIHVQFSYPDAPCTIDADPTRMQQVLWNLVLNARDALPNGGHIAISLDRVIFDTGSRPILPELEGGDWISLTVSDDGTGIAPETLPHIFEPFFTTKSLGKGTGLGLAQVHGIVKQHDGLIHVASSQGEGTTFTVFWPLAKRPTSYHPDDPSTVTAVLKGNGEKLLIVEDDLQTRQALVDGLTVLNYQATGAANGQQALAILHSGDSAIQLVVTDHIMPRMGAVEFCRELKRSGKDLPVIVVSGYSREDEIDILKQLGVVEYLRKPLCLEQLSHLIAQILDERQGPVEVQSGTRSGSNGHDSSRT
jgi:two-component system, cell cycle sensor histidine kinase and response regulator CckA